MSTLSRGSRTKLKQPNSKMDSIVLEAQLDKNPHEQSLDTRTSSPPMVEPHMAGPDFQHLSSPTRESVNNLLSIGSDPKEFTATTITAAHTVNGDLGAVHSDQDDRSSSLSDIEERPATNGVEKDNMRSSPPLEDYDTEAETERLEESPNKMRKQQTIVLSVSAQPSGITLCSKDENLSENTDHTTGAAVMGQKNAHRDLEDDVMDQTSDISSLEDTADDTSRPTSPAGTSGKKRKRSSQGTSAESDTSGLRSHKRAAIGLHDATLNQQVRLEVPELGPAIDGDAMRDHISEDGELSVDGEEAPNDFLQPTLHKSKKNHRFGTRTGQDGLLSRSSRSVSPNIDDADAIESNEAEESVGEDADIEDLVPGMEPETAARNEEDVMKKKAAMDSLGTIEKQFATLRDKLYDERLAELNEELAMLKEANPTHPGYLRMVECIDERRDEKIALANLRLKYRLESLQRKSVAERAIAHSQYMQTVRATREEILEKANEEWYQIHRERRSCNQDDELQYLYHFQPQRSHQIARQTAYNSEVSILSGIAKYTGFPAAPEIEGAKPSEVADDLKRMGSVVHPAPLRISSSLSNLSRQRPEAEEQFLEQNPWANPHHPVHHQISAAQRQLSLNSRPISPFTTPSGQRRIGEANNLSGSASTVTAIA